MKKKTVLITGSSRGIGRETALLFSRNHFNVIINSRQSKDQLANLEQQIISNSQSDCFSYLGDMGKETDVLELFDKIENRFGGIDVLINNAGISYIGLLSDMSLEAWNHIFSANLTSAFLCSKYALPYMLKKKAGKIINMSSVWGNTGASCETAYSASKGGLNSFTKALAKELAPSNIQVNAISCGMIDTEMNHSFSSEEIVEIEREIPAGRMGSPAEVAQLALQLAQSSQYLTGQIIGLDGGWC